MDEPLRSFVSEVAAALADGAEGLRLSPEIVPQTSLLVTILVFEFSTSDNYA
ncbi:hypothetical protein CY34DRAFT_19949 [Suillus luteus UH-Slu-Lm8-n1]|uniref:Uncharacterized protein n=1 Tax=Suillus luteus UH-Slu-Lm8-n1 TaxID=930992 RepID=A0A0C9ZQ58_9AGAM|nr:hypothetical protein CY34DRAFT_19949 [Suillus luteus UH-Slu-Lm8-n1]